MKSMISALALLLLAAPAFADTTIDITSVEVNEAQPNGKTWDLKIPKTTKHLPELIVEVIIDSKSALMTPVQKDSLSATFEGQSFSMKQGSSVIFKVWDKDPLTKELIAEIPFTLADQSGDVTLTNGGAKALKINVKAPAKAKAEAPAAEKPAEAPAAEKPAEAPAAEKPAEAPAAEKPAEAPAAEKPAAE